MLRPQLAKIVAAIFEDNMKNHSQVSTTIKGTITSTNSISQHLYGRKIYNICFCMLLANVLVIDNLDKPYQTVFLINFIISKNADYLDLADNDSRQFCKEAPIHFQRLSRYTNTPAECSIPEMFYT